ncbi:MAG: MotA/TolQ/ExbB proton channel family protein [Bacteriovoracia bacterium]
MAAETPTWIYFTLFVSRLVLIILVGLSVWSVSIMIERYRLYKKTEEEEAKLSEILSRLVRERNWDELKNWVSKNPGLKTGMLNAALDVREPEIEKIDRAVRSFLTTEKVRLEKGFTVLATLGSNAPFIGLFGTVLGIIQAFGALSTARADSSSVIAGISEALVATAIGLFVAIPAVIAYNVFSRKLRLLMADCEALKDLYLAHKG